MVLTSSNLLFHPCPALLCVCCLVTFSLPDSVGLLAPHAAVLIGEPAALIGHFTWAK